MRINIVWMCRRGWSRHAGGNDLYGVSHLHTADDADAVGGIELLLGCLGEPTTREDLEEPGREAIATMVSAAQQSSKRAHATHNQSNRDQACQGFPWVTEAIPEVWVRCVCSHTAR